MGYPIGLNSATQPLRFLMVQSGDHLTGATSLTPTVTLCKAGSSTFATPAGAVTELANGWYQVAANATDSNTLGPLILHATASGADPTDELFPVVPADPTIPQALANSCVVSGTPTTLTFHLTFASAVTAANLIGKQIFWAAGAANAGAEPTITAATQVSANVVNVTVSYATTESSVQPVAGDAAIVG